MPLSKSNISFNASLDDLPTELLVKIILDLDWRSVLRLQLVNTTFNAIIRTHVAVQYHVELGVAGKVNGPSFPHCPLTTDERLRRLRQHQLRWKRFAPARAQAVRKVTGAIWELAGGVLGQGVASNVNEHIGRSAVKKLLFTRLPAGERGEWKTREWTHEYSDFAVRDFTMDPSQDLLVLLRESNGSGNHHQAPHPYPHPHPQAPIGGAGNGPAAGGDDLNVAEVHLRSLRTNEKHADAKLSVLVHPLHGGTTRTTSHSLQICQDRLAILHKARAGHWPEKLVVYDWKKGKLLFEISFCGIMSFAFLTPKHLLFAVQPFNVMPACHGDHQPRLVICDIDYTAALSPTGHPESYAAICEFHLPELRQYADVVDILIRTDPAPSWPCSNYANESEATSFRPPKPNDVLSPAPAFSTAPQNRLFVITMQVETVFDDMGDHRASESINLGLFVPLSTFLPYLNLSSPDSNDNNNDASWSCVRKPEIIPANTDPTETLYFGDFTARPLRRIAVQPQDWMMASPDDNSVSEGGEGMKGGVRALLLPGAESTWVCNVFGMRAAYALEPRDIVAPLAPRHVAILDFNVDAIRRDHALACAKQREVQRQESVGRDSASSSRESSPGSREGTPESDSYSSSTTSSRSVSYTDLAREDSEADSESSLVSNKTHIEDYLEPGTLEAWRCGVFEEDVTTALPYRRTVLREKVRFHGVMLTEDNVIFVNQRAPREYEVLTI